MRYYGIDLRDALWGTDWRAPSTGKGWIGVRRLRSLIDGLPNDSAYFKLRNPEYAQFEKSLPHYAALTVEELDAQRSDFIQANSTKGFKRPEPMRLPRPWDPPPEPIKTGADLFTFIQQVGVGG